MTDFDLSKITGREPPVETDEDMVNALAESIKARGVQVPLLVRRTEKGKYMLIDGERRLRAAREADEFDDDVELEDADPTHNDQDSEDLES